MRLLLVIIALSFISLIKADAESDKVNLTAIGASWYTSEIYSGYIPLNFPTTKKAHYMFYASMNNMTSDPIIVWLQGGPGCSGLFGAFYEFGPLKLT